MQRNQLTEVVDFAVSFGERLLTCGGEIWRVDELLTRIFNLYDVKADVFILPHTLMITAEDDNGDTVVRHHTVGDILVNMTELSELDALLASMEKERPATRELAKRFAAISHKPYYPKYITILGMIIALSCLNYFIGGGLVGGVFIVCGIAVAMGTQMYLGEIFTLNRFFLCAMSAFLAGVIIMTGARLGLGYDPTLIMVITSIGLIPGIPLINACREVLCGRVLSGGLLFMTAFLETMAVAAGFSIAAMIFGGAA